MLLESSFHNIRMLRGMLSACLMIAVQFGKGIYIVAATLTAMTFHFKPVDEI